MSVPALVRYNTCPVGTYHAPTASSKSSANSVSARVVHVDPARTTTHRSDAVGEMRREQDAARRRQRRGQRRIAAAESPATRSPSTWLRRNASRRSVCVSSRSRQSNRLPATLRGCRSLHGVRELDRSSAGGGNSAQLPVGDESDPRAVRGEERSRSPFRAGQRSRSHFVSALDVKLARSRQRIAEYEGRSVGRERRLDSRT